MCVFKISDVQIYIYRNIGLYSIAPCQVITLDLFCLNFVIIFLLLFLISLSGDSTKFSFPLSYRPLERERASNTEKKPIQKTRHLEVKSDNFCHCKVGRAITIQAVIQKSSILRQYLDVFIFIDYTLAYYQNYYQAYSVDFSTILRQ